VSTVMHAAMHCGQQDERVMRRTQQSMFQQLLEAGILTTAAERPIGTALAAAYKTESHTVVRTFDGSGNCAVWSMHRTT